MWYSAPLKRYFRLCSSITDTLLQTTDAVRHLYSVLRQPENSRNLALVANSLAINILSLAVPIVTLQIYDRVLTYRSEGTLRVLLIGVVIAILLDASLRLIRGIITAKNASDFEHRLGTAAATHMLHADLNLSSRRGAGAYVQDFNSLQKLKEFYNGQLLSVAVDVPFILIFVGLIAYLGGLVVLAPVVLLAMFTTLAWHNGKQLKAQLVARDAHDDNRFSTIIETLGGMPAIKALAVEPLFQRRYERAQGRVNGLNYQVARLHGMAGSIGVIFGQLMVAGVVAIAAPMIVSGSITTGTMIACVLLAGRIMQPVQRALGLWTKAQDIQLCTNRIKTLMNLPSRAANQGLMAQDRLGTLDCIDLGFTYHPDQPYVLNDIHLTLKTGQTIAITGEHSSGKTTLLSLLAGLYEPSRGRALIDGMDINALPPTQRCQHVAYLPTEAVIFKGTILENLTGFRKEFTDNAMTIARYLDIDAAVSRLPKGFETRLEGGNSDVIPPGLQQRIAIARALLHRPKVILFDHADRSLDRAGYNALYQLLGQLQPMVAMVIVSDDRNLLQLADRQYTLQRGVLVPVELLMEDSSFRIPTGYNASEHNIRLDMQGVLA